MTTSQPLLDLYRQREELRAEYRATTSRKEMNQIFDEYRLTELTIVALERKAEREAIPRA